MTLYLANPAGSAALRAMERGALGFIDTPRQGNRRPAGVTWCADNGCFGRGYPGDEGWLGWLAKHRADAGRCLFATAPDVVGDARATLERSRPFLPRIRELGFPAALVAQNGLEHLEVPWDEFDVLFLGGSPECRPCAYVRPIHLREQKLCPRCNRRLEEWKLGAAARRLTFIARARGKRVHMGRVNSRKRYVYAKSIGCVSVDGTFLVRGPTVNLPKLLSWLGEAA